MSECSTSLRVSLRALTVGSLPCREIGRQSKSLLGRYLPPNIAGWQHRRRSTVEAATPAASPSSIVYASGLPGNRHGNWQGSQGIQSLPREGGFVATSGISSRTLKQELRYLKDPMKLADHIRYTLRDGKLDKVVDLARMASKDMQCTVSWNHIIDFQMTQGRVNNAIKTYNEMKKRGQIPDSYTYVLLFRGLASYAHYPQALAKALSIYHSMSSAKSPVRPSVIHTNAVLKVCARANDMDALWGIAAKLPEFGIGAPNNLTWTTILNALQRSALVDTESLEEPEEKSRRIGKAVLEGRRMWDDIIGRWRKGNMWIDEELVCAMGRLLLIGDKQEDWDDVLSLVEQTMAIPRLKPRLEKSYRETASTSQTREPEGDHPKLGGQDFEHGGEFQMIPVDQPDSSGNKVPSFTYTVPGRNTLSLILEACMKMRTKKLAIHYWALLTDGTKFQIQPDLDNFHAHMRVLRFSRSSEETLELMRNGMPAAKVKPTRTSFWIAMSTCMRDKNNPNVVDSASKILDLMQNELQDPDIRTIRLYLELAVATDKGPNIVKALRRLGPSTVNIRSLLAYGLASSGNEVDQATKNELLLLLRRMVGCYDRLLNRGEVPRETYSSYMKERSKIAAIATRYSGTDQSKLQEKREED